MRAASNHAVHANDTRAVVGLWVGALAPPFAWGPRLSLLALFAALLCEAGGMGWLYGIALVALLIAGSGGLIAWRIYRPTVGQPASASADATRRSYFGLVGMLGSIIFGGAIFAQTPISSGYADC